MLTLKSVEEGDTLDVQGLKCVIETPQFTLRVGKDFINPSPAHYGYIDGYIGADGDEVDCYVGSQPYNKLVYVVDQNKLWGPFFDEHKVFLSFQSKNEAIKTFFFGHLASRRIFRAITTLEIEEFKHWLKHGNKKIPISETDYGKRQYKPTEWWKHFE